MIVIQGATKYCCRCSCCFSCGGKYIYIYICIFNCYFYIYLTAFMCLCLCICVFDFSLFTAARVCVCSCVCIYLCACSFAFGCLLGCSNSRAVTLVLYGGTQMLVAEAERSVHDALCVVSALVRDGRVVAGGGAAEIAAARAVESQADTVSSVGQYAARAFSDALLGLAEALAANSGLSPIHEVQRVKAMQQQSNCPYYGIDCMQTVCAHVFSL